MGVRWLNRWKCLPTSPATWVRFLASRVLDENWHPHIRPGAHVLTHIHTKYTTVVIQTTALSWSIHFINKHKRETFIIKHISIEKFYSLEAISVLFVFLTSSQPHLIFIIFLLKQGKESPTLHIRTTVGTTIAIIKVGGVYHTNWLISTHLFQAKTKACTVPRRRETIPSLICKRKYIVILSKGWFSNSRFHPYPLRTCSAACKSFHLSTAIFSTWSIHTFVSFLYALLITRLLGNCSCF